MHFQEEDENVKSLRTTDDGRKRTAIAHSSLRLRWAKKREKKQRKQRLTQIKVVVVCEEMWVIQDPWDMLHMEERRKEEKQTERKGRKEKEETEKAKTRPDQNGHGWWGIIVGDTRPLRYAPHGRKEEKEEEKEEKTDRMNRESKDSPRSKWLWLSRNSGR